MDELENCLSQLNLTDTKHVKQSIISFMTSDTIIYYAKRGFNYISVQIDPGSVKIAVQTVEEIGRSLNAKLTSKIIIEKNNDTSCWIRIFWS